jgi:glutaredoxin
MKTTLPSRPPRRAAARAALLLVAMLPLASALAQYKVVRPDGSVTYTDRPPTAAANVRITPLGRGTQAAQAAADNTLPAELRQAVSRYPVTLYSAADCPPCDRGRTLLLQRGVPFTERRVANEDEAALLERVVGGRTVPALMIGAQPLRGVSEAEWTAYLDAAGYPRESRLPRNWPVPVPLPLIDRPAAGQNAAQQPPPQPGPPREEPPTVPVLPNAGVRF